MKVPFSWLKEYVDIDVTAPPRVLPYNNSIVFPSSLYADTVVNFTESVAYFNVACKIKSMKTGISSYTNIPHKSLFFISVLYWSNYQFSPAYDILVSLPTPIW